MLSYAVKNNLEKGDAAVAQSVSENKRWLYLVLLIALAAGSYWRALPVFLKYSHSQLLFGTVVTLDICYERGQKDRFKKAAAAVWERLEEIQWRMNIYDDRSDVIKVNNSFSVPVAIGADTYYVIEQALYFHQLSEGVFDITVWPLSQLWKKAAANNRLPSRAEVERVKKIMGPRNLNLLENNQIQIRHPETQIDLGGIAAGYAEDEAARILRSHGLPNFLIDAGGEFYAGGYNCHNKPWRIGIKNPHDRSKIIGVIEVSDKAVSTSGNYEQYFMIEGQEWTHIIHPVTGYPAKGILSATVIAPRGIDADAMATALCILDPPSGLRVIDALGEEWAAFIITSNTDGSLKFWASQNYQRLQRQAQRQNNS